MVLQSVFRNSLVPNREAYATFLVELGMNALFQAVLFGSSVLL